MNNVGQSLPTHPLIPQGFEYKKLNLDTRLHHTVLTKMHSSTQNLFISNVTKYSWNFSCLNEKKTKQKNNSRFTVTWSLLNTSNSPNSHTVLLRDTTPPEEERENSPPDDSAFVHDETRHALHVPFCTVSVSASYDFSDAGVEEESHKCINASLTCCSGHVVTFYSYVHLTLGFKFTFAPLSCFFFFSFLDLFYSCFPCVPQIHWKLDNHQVIPNDLGEKRDKLQHTETHLVSEASFQTLTLSLIIWKIPWNKCT